ncbi:MAG: hypothetical protein H0Z32_10425 [Bacillaceae bacterium]|nr:hypothetical protein [Bacillaceae bacterium]
MVDFFLFIGSLLGTVFVIHQIISAEKIRVHTVMKEAGKNILLLLWGIPLVFFMLLIPYAIWNLTGKSHGGDGVYIIGFSAIGSVVFTFSYFYHAHRKNEKAG